MYAYSGILAALLQRGRTGQGSHLDVSLLETSVEWMSFPLYYAYQGAPAPPRTGAAHATIYPYGPFRTGGGGHVMLGLQNEREWVIFCEKVLREPGWAKAEEFATNSRRVAARVRLESIILEAFAGLDAAEVVARLDAAGIANARINEVADVWAHPQLAARKRWTEVATPAGRVPALIPPAMLSGTEARMDPVPALGEHTESILRELGLSSERIERLCGAQVS
jgi:itaconate CoA-transferase